jgi:hypothetical protein
MEQAGAFFMAVMSWFKIVGLQTPAQIIGLVFLVSSGTGASRRCGKTRNGSNFGNSFTFTHSANGSNTVFVHSGA